MVEVPGFTLPGFTVGDEIGRGGFGVVHRARDLASGRDVAVKFLRPSAGAQELRQFDAERRAVNALPDHPGLPRILASGRASDGSPFVAMPLLPGGSLADRVPLPPGPAVAVCARIADTLQVAHDAGIVHRDVKAANVLFDAIDRPVLVDFGLASRAGADTVSASDDVAVSIGFAAPEVLAGASADASADVYALGATLFCLLAGRPPFVPRTGSEPVTVVAARIAQAPVEDLRPSGVPDTVCRIVERAMAKAPAARHGSAAELAVALRSAGRELGTSPAARLRRVVSTRRRAPLAGVAAAAVLFGGAVTAVAVTSSGSGSGRPASQLGGSVPRAAGGSPADALGGAGRSGAQDGSADAAGGGAAVAGLPGLPAAGSARAAGSATVAAPGSTAASPSHPARRTTPGRPVSLHPVPSHPTTAALPPNHAPTLSARGGTFDEHASLHLAVTTADADHDHVSVAARNLPSWLHLSGGRLTGTIPYRASTATRTHTNIRSTAYAVTLTATDSHGATASRSITLHVRDTLRAMPDYIGKTGRASPTIYAVSTVNRSCAYQKSGNGTRIYWQSVRPGTVISWGRNVTYLYGRNRTSCRHVSNHYPS